MLTNASLAGTFWPTVTRLGEVQIVLPALLLSMGWLLRRRADVRLVAWWSCLVAAAVLVTLVSKVAFIGYGLGVPVLNFTGVSGHAMCAAVVYPLLACLLTADRPAAWQRAAVLAGVALALLIGVSRVLVGAHSPSEAVAGLALGGAASAAALGLARRPVSKAPVWLPLCLALWLGITPGNAPPSQSHNLVTRLSLAVSGRATPYTRDEMLRAWRREQGREPGRLSALAATD